MDQRPNDYFKLTKFLYSLVFILVLFICYIYINRQSIFRNNDSSKTDQISKLPERTPTEQLSSIKSHQELDLPLIVSEKVAELSDLPADISGLFLNAVNLNVKYVTYDKKSTGFNVTYTTNFSSENSFRPTLNLIRHSKFKIIQGLFIYKAAIIDFEDANYTVSMEFLELNSSKTNVKVFILKK